MSKSLNPDNILPLYHQLKELLKEAIESGEWQPGDRIPSENELRKQYGISRNTAIKALDDLVREGLLYRAQGKGTFVAAPKIEQSLTGFYSFSKVLREKGLEPRDILLGLKMVPVKPSIGQHLQLPESTPVWALERLRCAGEEPIILETSYIPQDQVPELSRDMLKDSSLYSLLEREYGIIVTRAKETFEPILIREYESRHLQVSPGYPALLLDRIAFDARGRPVEFCRSVVRGDRCRFYTELL